MQSHHKTTKLAIYHSHIGIQDSDHVRPHITLSSKKMGTMSMHLLHGVNVELT